MTVFETPGFLLCLFGHKGRGALKKKPWDFFSMMEVPEASEKSSRIDLILWDCLRVGEAMSIVSSIN